LKETVEITVFEVKNASAFLGGDESQHGLHIAAAASLKVILNNQ